MMLFRLRVLLLSMVLLPVTTLGAGDPVGELVRQLQASGKPSEAQLYELEQSADGLFVLGWLHEQGGYGVPLDTAKAWRYFHLAAQGGQAEVLRYCWQRCLEQTEVVHRQIAAAAEREAPQGLYLQSLLLAQQANEEGADAYLVKAARKQHPEAIAKLYVDHFVRWAGQRRGFDEAEAKLRRCAAEGIAVCYYLLGALYERHRDAQGALRNYLILELVDEELYQDYLSGAHLRRLEARLPAQSLPVLRSQVATELAFHTVTKFDRINRFRVCAADSSYGCVSRVARRDSACIPALLADRFFKGFRDSAAYLDCLAITPAAE